MALQDLTPQLRTRLSRMERAVGWFVFLAVALLLFGFCYYLYNTAKRKGWFLTKAPYFTFVDTAEGLRVGDPVLLMGFDAGVIREVTPMPADDFTYNVYVEFQLREPNFGYIWTEGSRAKITAADFLGKRVLEVSKGTGGYPTFLSYPLRSVPLHLLSGLPGEPAKWLLAQELYDATGTNLLAKPMIPLNRLPESAALASAGYTNILVFDAREARKSLTAVWNFREGAYEPFTPGVSKFWLLSDEAPPVSERLQQVVAMVEHALPGVFSLTNQLSALLTNSDALARNLNQAALDARPAVSNLARATASLDQPGGLGAWLLPTNVTQELEATLGATRGTLGAARQTLDTANTNLVVLAQSLLLSLDNLASLTSNLNEQVEANSNLLSGISQTITNANHFVQGLKKHWLLRSAFRDAPAPQPAPRAPSQQLRSPRDAGR